MITDELLQIAAAEANQTLCASLPPASACEHCFSPQFERSMKRVLRRAKHPAVYRYLRRAACFFIALILAGTSWLTIDAKARAVFFDWVRQQYKSFVEYRFTGTPPEGNEAIRFAPTWLPAGFEETKTQQADGLLFSVYSSSDGRALYFICSQGADASSLFIAAEDAETKAVFVGDLPADFYQASDPQDASVLVWQSEAGDLLFSLSGALPQSDLIRIAESVTEK